MTTETEHKNLPVPDEGQNDWDDELHETFDIIDVSLKGINENTINKDGGTFGGLQVTSSASFDDDVTVHLGTNDDLELVYNSTENTSYLTDNDSDETLLALPHGSGKIKTDRVIQNTTTGSDLATESYVDGSVNPDTISSQSVNDVLNAAEFDGSNGGEMIQAAIDELPSQGGTVWVPPNGPDGGQWNVSSHILLRSDIKLHSSGATLYLENGTNDNMLMTNVSEGDALVENVVIEGFHMDSNRSNNGQWTRPDGKTVNPACVFCLESDNVTVRDCTFTSSRGYGVKFALSMNGTVESCYATDMGDDGFTATDTRYSTSKSEYNSFENCVSELNNDAGFEVDDGAKHTTFENCVSIGNTEGFDAHTHDLEDTPASWQYVYYTNCAAFNCDYGWKIGANNHDDQATGVEARNIYVEGSSIAAFSSGGSSNTADSPADHVTVDGFIFNHPSSASDAAIDLKSGSIVRDWSFSNGYVNTGTYGVDGSQEIENITLSNIEVDCSSSTQSDGGIELNAGSSGTTRNIAIENCVVHDAINAGIQMWSNGGTHENISIIGGKFYNNGQNNTNDEGATGISINDNGSAPTQINVIGVQCFDNQDTKTQRTGIWWNGVTNSTFVGNILIENSTSSTAGTLGTGSVTAGNVT